MSKTALITLTPLEPFFFGGESTHGNGESANYYAKSNPYPQQTSICGTLRHLLFKNGYERGLNSFTPDDPKLNDYGDLLSISPLFLSNGKEEYFLRQAIDRHTGQPILTLTEALKNEWVLIDSAESKWQNARRWQGFELKNDLSDEWVSPKGNNVKPEQIFKSFSRPGIPKKEIQKPKPGGPGLFKQDLIRLESGWAFCVLAEFEDVVDLTKLNGQLFQLGGEKSIFHFSIVEEKRNFANFFPVDKMFYDQKSTSDARLVLISDTWVNDEAWQYTIGAITETTNFRHIRTHAKVEEFARLHPPFPGTGNEPTDQMTKSIKYTLLRRGSVLISADKTSLENLAQKLTIAPWTTIGFNHFFTYP